MKRKINVINLDDSIKDNIVNGLLNYTHYQLKNGGIILTSNKNWEYMRGVKVFIPYHLIKVIY